jgi:hypothetical protein
LDIGPNDLINRLELQSVKSVGRTAPMRGFVMAEKYAVHVPPAEPPRPPPPTDPRTPPPLPDDPLPPEDEPDHDPVREPDEEFPLDEPVPDPDNPVPPKRVQTRLVYSPQVRA